jgi:hypothetical protein
MKRSKKINSRKKIPGLEEPNNDFTSASALAYAGKAKADRARAKAAIAQGKAEGARVKAHRARDVALQAIVKAICKGEELQKLIKSEKAFADYAAAQERECSHRKDKVLFKTLCRLGPDQVGELAAAALRVDKQCAQLCEMRMTLIVGEDDDSLDDTNDDYDSDDGDLDYDGGAA